MSARPLNLLRYPRQRLVLSPALLRACLVAGLIGVLAGGLWIGWQHLRLVQRHEQLTQLQARWQARSQQQADVSAQRERAGLRRQWLERATDWRDRREQLSHLHRALQALADGPGLRVERWQGDGRRLVLQAWLPGSEQVPTLMAGLSAAGPLSWQLHSLADHSSVGGEAGIDVVLEAPWPAASQGGGPSRP